MVLRHIDGLNLSNLYVSIAFLFLISCFSINQSIFMGYSLEDYRRYCVDGSLPRRKGENLKVTLEAASTGFSRPVTIWNTSPWAGCV